MLKYKRRGSSNCSMQHVMDGIFAFTYEKGLVPTAGRVYDFEHIRDAAAARDVSVNGKTAVVT